MQKDMSCMIIKQLKQLDKILLKIVKYMLQPLF